MKIEITVMFVWLCSAGENGSVSETGSSSVEQLLDADIAAAAAAADDDDDDGNAGRDMSETEVKPTVVDSVASHMHDSRHQLDVAEQQSAALYVSRLSQFIATLVSNATSLLDADKLMQDFSSTFCTGRASITGVVQVEQLLQVLQVLCR